MHKVRPRRRAKLPRRTTRITVDMSSEKHKRIKAIAALQGDTLQEFILACVDDKIHEPSGKTKIEQLEALGLVGGIEESEITSTNYREFIRKRVKAKHEKPT